MIPSLGRIVHYRLTHTDVVNITRRRADFMHHRGATGYSNTGYVAHFGNPVREGQAFPAAIVRTWPEDHISGDTVVNLKVLLDGADDLWVTGIQQGLGEGQWSEPVRV